MNIIKIPLALLAATVVAGCVSQRPEFTSIDHSLQQGHSARGAASSWEFVATGR